MEYFDNSDSIQLIDQKRSEKYEIIKKNPRKKFGAEKIMIITKIVGF
ncbi:MAG: hypothetical protein CM15mP93_00620 [Thiotrichaceae bacterium]|nr:MAG: hypothetical protein CM15mP93_00620 [Thiotrichaceae bacterium]